MKKFKLIGNYSSTSIEYTTHVYYNEVLIPLCKDGKFSKFGMDHVQNILKEINIFPTEDAYDLIALALLVYIADTRISRETHSQDSWSREIFIELPVANRDLWANKKSTIDRMLKFLTGDIWSITFLERSIRFADVDCKRTDQYDVISLFSGGMDSLINTVNLMEKGKNTLLVAHAAEGLVKKAQTDIIKKIDGLYPNVKHSLIDFWTSIPKDLIKEGGEEKTTRSRSFLFIALAIFVATGTENIRKLIIPENGLIAINVPMDSNRVGAHSTRTTHPFYLYLWNELLSDLGFNIAVENIYWNMTKGEMAEQCLNKKVLYDIIPFSTSCSSPGKERFQGLPPQHCGYCLPCLIRRAAMHKAFGKDNTTYANLSVSKMVNERIQEKGVQMRSIQYAIQRVKNDPTFAEYAILKPGPLNQDKKYLKELANVYTRGLMEVDQWIQDSMEQENAD